jgi:cytochrome c oxidase subunit III
LASHPATLAHHFEDSVQQRQAAELGMWLFLATEFMFFGGLFLAYLVYRVGYPVDPAERGYAAEFAAGSRHMDLVLGTINTAVLLTSSLTMALAVDAAERSRRAALIRLLSITLVLGLVFLGIKAFEYYHKYEEHLIPFAGLPFRYSETQQAAGMATYFNLYFLMTGLHAFHMVIGAGILSFLIWLAARSRLPAERAVIVFNAGLYWHFVDLVWVYLFPFFYLVIARTG